MRDLQPCPVFKPLLIVAALSGALAGSHTAAAPLDLVVRGAGGQPLEGAVVTLETPHAPAGPIRFPWPLVMAQRDIAFVPHVLIVPVGASVAFPNKDKVRHHVYSFSKPKRFELKLYGQEEARTVAFDKPGVVAIGCNIHDAMSGFIVVVATPYAIATDAAGRAHLDVPPGGATLRLWHPSLRAAGNQTSEAITIPAAGLARTIALGGS